MLKDMEKEKKNKCSSWVLPASDCYGRMVLTQKEREQTF